MLNCSFVDPYCVCCHLLYVTLNSINCCAGDIYCGEVFQKIANTSNTKTAHIGDSQEGSTCLIFDEDVFKKNGPKKNADFDRFCGVSKHCNIFWAVY